MEITNDTWHQEHMTKLTAGQRLADRLAEVMGSWNFIIAQSLLIVIWVGINITAYLWSWDPYPFILLNLLFSVQAAYAAPIIMMAQNRQSERDRIQARNDYVTDVAAKKKIEDIQQTLIRIEADKLDLILKTLGKYR